MTLLLTSLIAGCGRQRTSDELNEKDAVSFGWSAAELADAPSDSNVKYAVGLNGKTYYADENRLFMFDPGSESL